MTDSAERPRRPVRSEGPAAMVLLGSGLLVAALVAVAALWRYDVIRSRRLTELQRQHPAAVTAPLAPTVP